MYGIRFLKLTVLILAVIETFTDSVINCVIYTFTYTTVDDSNHGDDSSISPSYLPYYIIAYFLPTKHLYKVIIVLYVPALCLWRVRKRAAAKDEDEHIANNAEVIDVDQKRLQTRSVICSHICRVAYYGHKVSHPRSLFYLIRKLFDSFSKLKLHAYEQLYWQFIGQKPYNNSNLVHGAGNVNEFVLPSDTLGVTCNKQSSTCISWGALIHQKDQRYQDVLKHYNTKFLFYRNLPLKLASYVYGRIHQCVLPVWLRGFILHGYIWIFSCKLEDAAIRDLKRYRNLSEFFRRSLRKGIRPVCRSADLTSPADGILVHYSIVTGGCLEQIKGVRYSMVGFLGPYNTFLESALSCVAEVSRSRVPLSALPCDTFHNLDTLYCERLVTRPGNCLYQCIIYLSPGDYHHFHSPADWNVLARRHFPGELLSVSPSVSRWIQGVFNFNERVFYMGQWQHGFFSMTAVGATLVGSINVYFDKTLSTNSLSSWPSGCFYDKSFMNQSSAVRLTKGQPMGDFRLGSTIVLLFEAPIGFQFEYTAGQRVKYGCSIGKTKSRKRTT